MLPAPARIAPPPSPKSKTSWTPAVPPPPVEGAVVGYALADRLGVGDVLAVAVADAAGDTVAVGDFVAVTVADAVGDFVEPAEELAFVVGGTLVKMAGVVLEMAGVVVEEVPEQAESTTQARMAETP